MKQYENKAIANLHFTIRDTIDFTLNYELMHMAFTNTHTLPGFDSSAFKPLIYLLAYHYQQQHKGNKNLRYYRKGNRKQ